MKQVSGELALLGDINIDAIMPVEFYPRPGEIAFSEQVRLNLGGAVTNTAIMLARLGLPIRLISCTGKDEWGKMALDQLAAEGINLSYVKKAPSHHTGLVFIAVTRDGERTIFSCRGANIALRSENIQPVMLENVQLLHLTGYSFLQSPQREASIYTATLAKEMRIPISIEIGPEPARLCRDDMLNLLPDLSICVIGLEESYTLFGLSEPLEALNALRNFGVQCAAVKLSDEGCYIGWQNCQLHTLAFQVNTVDTTGAGDSFAAGILYSWLNDFSPNAMSIFANTLGALATTRYGAGVNLPSSENITSFLKNLANEEHSIYAKGALECLRNLE